MFGFVTCEDLEEVKRLYPNPTPNGFVLLKTPPGKDITECYAAVVENGEWVQTLSKLSAPID